MLIRIVATNFRSYGQETEFNMLSSSNVRRFDWHVHNRSKGASVLRTGIIYGANGSGKSGLIKALGRLQDMVLYGSVPPLFIRDANKYNNRCHTKERVTFDYQRFKQENSHLNSICHLSLSTVTQKNYIFAVRIPSHLISINIDNNGNNINKSQ